MMLSSDVMKCNVEDLIILEGITNENLCPRDRFVGCLGTLSEREGTR